jgi:hypothetical protein
MIQLTKSENRLMVLLVTVLLLCSFIISSYVYAKTNSNMASENVVLLDSNGGISVGGNITGAFIIGGHFCWSNGTQLNDVLGRESVWYNGTGAPGSGLGSNGDFYLRLDNGYIYNKNSGSWVQVADLTGPQGIQGLKGDKGDKGDTGAIGATGPDGADGQDGSKGDKGNKGDTGEKGDTGTTGPAGTNGNDGRDAKQPIGPYSFLIGKWPNATYYAQNGTDGHIAFASNDCTQVMQPVVNALTNGGKIVFGQGIFYFYSSVYLPYGINFYIEGMTTPTWVYPLAVPSSITPTDGTQLRMGANFLTNGSTTYLFYRNSGNASQGVLTVKDLAIMPPWGETTENTLIYGIYDTHDGVITEDNLLFVPYGWAEAGQPMPNLSVPNYFDSQVLMGVGGASELRIGYISEFGLNAPTSCGGFDNIYVQRITIDRCIAPLQFEAIWQNNINEIDCFNPFNEIADMHVASVVASTGDLNAATSVINTLNVESFAYGPNNGAYLIKLLNTTTDYITINHAMIWSGRWSDAYKSLTNNNLLLLGSNSVFNLNGNQKWITYTSGVETFVWGNRQVGTIAQTGIVNQVFCQYYEVTTPQQINQISCPLQTASATGHLMLLIYADNGNTPTGSSLLYFASVSSATNTVLFKNINLLINDTTPIWICFMTSDTTMILYSQLSMSVFDDMRDGCYFTASTFTAPMTCPSTALDSSKDITCLIGYTPF